VPLRTYTHEVRPLSSSRGVVQLAHRALSRPQIITLWYRPLEVLLGGRHYTTAVRPPPPSLSLGQS